MFLLLLADFFPFVQLFVEERPYLRKRELLILLSFSLGQGVKPILDMSCAACVLQQELLTSILTVPRSDFSFEIQWKMKLILPLVHCLESQAGKYRDRKSTRLNSSHT